MFKPEGRTRNTLTAGIAAITLFGLPPAPNAQPTQPAPSSVNVASLPKPSIEKKPSLTGPNIEVKSGASLISPSTVGVVVEGPDNQYIFDLYDLPVGQMTSEQHSIISKLFDRQHVLDFQQPQTRINAPANPNTIQNSSLDEFATIWNVYREANNGFNWNKDYYLLTREIAKLRSTLAAEKQLSSSIKRRISSNEIKKITDPKLIDDQKKIFSKIQATTVALNSEKNKLQNLESLLKNEQKAERLMVMLSVLNRNLSKSHPQTSAENIRSPNQYSWTRKIENKFPMSKPDRYSKELISIKALMEIETLYTKYIRGKSIAQAKTAILDYISNFLNIDVRENLGNCTDYNTTSLLPYMNGGFTRRAKEIMGKDTEERVGGQLQGVLSVNNFIIGGHTFIGRK